MTISSRLATCVSGARASRAAHPRPRAAQALPFYVPAAGPAPAPAPAPAWPFSRSLASAATPHTKSSSSGDSRASVGGWLWAIPVVTFGLGVWQIQRLQWKNSLIQQAQDRIYPHDNTPIPFLTSAQVPSIVPVDAQFTRMLATGTFLHDQEILVGPRSLNMAFVSTSDGGGASAGNGGLIGGSAKIGYTVVTPFRLEDGTTILVNRGWIPREMASDRRRREPQGTVTIEGILRDGEPKNYIQMLTIPNKPEKNQWHAIHLDQMSSWAKTSPVILQMTDESQLNALFEGAGQPVLAHPNANFRNQHLEYAITWFSLCAASSLLLVRSNRGLRLKWR